LHRFHAQSRDAKEYDSWVYLDLHIRYSAGNQQTQPWLFVLLMPRLSRQNWLKKCRGNFQFTEEGFYEPFCRMVKSDLDEVTELCRLGWRIYGQKVGHAGCGGCLQAARLNLLSLPSKLFPPRSKLTRPAGGRFWASDCLRAIFHQNLHCDADFHVVGRSEPPGSMWHVVWRRACSFLI